MSTISLRGLSKIFGSFQAVNNLDLNVEGGEFLSLLGPSGCGKTTTLQMVAGFVPPTSGSVLVEGENLTHVAPEKRDMGIVFQSYALFPHMTIAQNVGFGLEMRKMKNPALTERIDEALAMVRLSGLEDRYPSQLSGGQRQRVAIARVLAIRPRVLLLDEPMSNLDAKLRGDMHVELRALQRRLGITTILVTHDQVEAMTMSDRIAVMTGGKIAELGSPQQVYDKPISEFAYRFLGQTNEITADISSRKEGSATARVGSVSIPVNLGADYEGSQIKLFIRPERLRISNPENAAVKGKITTRLFLGGVWFYDVDSDIGKLRISAPNLGTSPADEGETVGIDWKSGDVQVATSEVEND